jgi:hypothetical protein
MSEISINSIVISALHEGVFLRVIELPDAEGMVKCIDEFGSDNFTVPYSALKVFDTSDPLFDFEKRTLEREIMLIKEREARKEIGLIVLPNSRNFNGNCWVVICWCKLLYHYLSINVIIGKPNISQW